MVNILLQDYPNDLAKRQLQPFNDLTPNQRNVYNELTHFAMFQIPISVNSYIPIQIFNETWCFSNIYNI